MTSSTSFQCISSRNFSFGGTDPCLANSVVETLLDSVKWDEKGLAVAIVQNVDTGAILMQGFVNRDAIATTISTKRATFYSRSRSSLCTKGETSNNFINVHDIFLDCVRDSVCCWIPLLFFLNRTVISLLHSCEAVNVVVNLTVSDNLPWETGWTHLPHWCRDLLLHVGCRCIGKQRGGRHVLTILYSLESRISQRKAEASAPHNGKPSWTKRLLLDETLLCEKIREEADELCRTLEENEENSRVAAEMGDVL